MHILWIVLILIIVPGLIVNIYNFHKSIKEPNNPKNLPVFLLIMIIPVNIVGLFCCLSMLFSGH
jgi:uncharacterized membrane protein YkvI